MQDENKVQEEKKELEQFYVEEDACIGCGMCVAMCDKIFAFNKNGKSYVANQPSDEKEVECAKDAVEACCVAAIKVGQPPKQD